MGFFTKIAKYIAAASIPTYKFEDNKLIFKIESEEFFYYDLGKYEIKTRHDSYVLEAYTLQNNDISLEHVRLDNNSEWNGQALSLYEGFIKEKLGTKVILAWNVISLILLFQIVISATFSFPTIVQQFAFEQPNTGILYFPFFWLPSFIVPIVFFAHFVSIRQLLKK